MSSIDEELKALGFLIYLLCSCCITAKVGKDLGTVSLEYSSLVRLGIFLWRVFYLIFVFICWPLKLLWHYVLKS